MSIDTHSYVNHTSVDCSENSRPGIAKELTSCQVKSSRFTLQALRPSPPSALSLRQQQKVCCSAESSETWGDQLQDDDLMAWLCRREACG